MLLSLFARHEFYSTIRTSDPRFVLRRLWRWASASSTVHLAARLGSIPSVMRRFLSRLARTGSDELRHRSLELASTTADGLRFEFRPERWRRERLRFRLVPCSPELLQAHDALARRDWSTAHGAIRSHFGRRPTRFLLDPAGRRAMVAAVRGRFPSAVDDALERADRLLKGRYDLLGYSGLSFSNIEGDIDWHLDPVHQRRAPLQFWARVPYLDPQLGDHKVIWELNRHQHWLALGRAAWLTGDRRYATAFGRQLENWLTANPPLAGINWASMLELAFRSLSWIWALHFFTATEEEGNPTWLIDLLVGLDRQLDHVARHLSVYFSPNTHLLGEGLALYVAGRALPELRSAARWEQIGRAVLVREARAQINADGGHAELSTHYHRYALDFYLLALAVARRTGDPTANRFADVASRLASFCRAMADDRGRLPTIGDDDGGLLFPICGRPPADASDSLSLAAALLGRPDLAAGDPPEEVLWMLGGDLASPVSPGLAGAPASQSLPDSGYVVLRSPAGHAILDAGRHGFLNGGHAHADALSVILSVSGRPLLIDPGTATYTMDPELRDRFRSTPMHNTAVVDGRAQSVPAGPFHWSSRADAQVDLWRPGLRMASVTHAEAGIRSPAPAETARVSAGFDYVEALHDGYLPLVHRRALLQTHDGLWLVADHFLGPGHHRVDTHWHLDPAWTLDLDAGPGTCLAHPEGLWAAIASTARERQEFMGDEQGLGWCAPVYGLVMPSLTLRYSEAGSAPFSLVTAIVAAPAPVRLSIESARVTTEREDGWHRAAVVVKRGGTHIVALFATPQGGHPRPPQGEQGNPAGVPRPRTVHRLRLKNGELATDARAAVLRFSESGVPSSLSLVDTTAATWTGRNSFTVAPLGAAQDLHFDRTALRQLSSEVETRSAG